MCFWHSHSNLSKITNSSWFSPTWTGRFANLKRLGGGGNAPPNLAISSQLTMKLGKDMLWLEIFIS